MHTVSSISPWVMILSLPVLYATLLAFVHLVVDFSPRRIREHRVTFRPIQTRIADWLLILRLLLDPKNGAHRYFAAAPTQKGWPEAAAKALETAEKLEPAPPGESEKRALPPPGKSNLGDFPTLLE